MMRRIAGFKRYAVLGMFSAALVSAACSDDDDDVSPDGNAGKAGSSGSAGKGSGGGSSGSATGGTGTAGSGTAGSSTAGKTNGGTGGTAAGGNAGTAPVGGSDGEGGMNEGGSMTSEGGAAGASGAPAGGEGGGGNVFVPDVLDNPGFETGAATTIPGWTLEGTPGAAFIDPMNAHSGVNKLSHWTKWTLGEANPPYTARTYQTVGPIANGTYSFSLWVNRDWEDTQYLYARGYDINDPNAEKKLDTTDIAGYTKFTLSGINVTSGKVTIGIYTAAPAGSFADIDDAELTLE